MTVAIIGISNRPPKLRKLFSVSEYGAAVVKEVDNINAYLAAGRNIIIKKRSRPISDLSDMSYGNYPGDGNHLTIDVNEAAELVSRRPDLRA